MKNLKRRDALKTVALAAGGLFACNAMALDTRPPKIPSLDGSWISKDKACAIFQQGSVLLIVNERGDLATAHTTGADSFTIVGGNGWARGLSAKLLDRGKSIQWSDATSWAKA